MSYLTKISVEGTEYQIKDSEAARFRGDIIALGYTSFSECIDIGVYSFKSSELETITNKPSDLKGGGILIVHPYISGNETNFAIFQTIINAQSEQWIRYVTSDGPNSSWVKQKIDISKVYQYRGDFGNHIWTAFSQCLDFGTYTFRDTILESIADKPDGLTNSGCLTVSPSHTAEQTAENYQVYQTITDRSGNQWARFISYIYPNNPWVMCGEDMATNIAKVEAQKIATAKVGNIEEKYFRSSVFNMVDIDTISYGKALNGAGQEYDVSNLNVTDFIAIEPDQAYSYLAAYNIFFYDENKNVLNYLSNGNGLLVTPFTTPSNAAYLRMTFRAVDTAQINKGETLKDYDDGKSKINPIYLPEEEKYTKKYKLEYETIKAPTALSAKAGNLMLIATKTICRVGEQPTPEAYLFYCEADNGLYIADAQMENVKYLCEWNNTISDNVSCLDFLVTITNDGDIIFLRRHIRQNPIIYPHNDYENPIIVDFGEALKPYGFLESISVVQFEDGSFVFGDYTTHKQADEDNNDPRCIWRVTKPYTNAQNWVVAHRFKHVYYSNPVSDEPDNEIGHVHTVVYDFYADTLYCSTGDIDRHCRVMRSKDKGVTWVQVVVGTVSNDPLISGQKYRSLGMIFLKDCCYIATDSFYGKHLLWKAERMEDGELDFVNNYTKVCNLEPSDRDATLSQATYGTMLLRNPNGLLFLDRAEPRADLLLDIPFYSFDDERLYIIATFKKNIFGLEVDERNGFCNQCFTEYQPITTDFVVTGGGNITRPNQTDILGNTLDNYIGCIKIRVVLENEIREP